MINQSKSQFRFLLMLGLLLFLPFSARAQTIINTDTYVEVGVVVTPWNGTQPFIAMSGASVGNTYTVPNGMILVLTDFVLVPQVGTPAPDPSTQFHVDIWGDNRHMVLEASLSDPLTRRVHLTTGMIVLPSQTVTATMTNSNGWPADIYAFGRLQSAY